MLSSHIFELDPLEAHRLDISVHTFQISIQFLSLRTAGDEYCEGITDCHYGAEHALRRIGEAAAPAFAALLRQVSSRPDPTDLDAHEHNQGWRDPESLSPPQTPRYWQVARSRVLAEAAGRARQARSRGGRRGTAAFHVQGHRRAHTAQSRARSPCAWHGYWTEGQGSSTRENVGPKVRCHLPNYRTYFRTTALVIETRHMLIRQTGWRRGERL